MQEEDKRSEILLPFCQKGNQNELNQEETFDATLM